MAESLCPGCKGAIGYENYFFQRDGELWHLVCLEDHVQKERSGRDEELAAYIQDL